MNYRAPLRDMRFLCREMFDGASLLRLHGDGETTQDDVEAVLEQANKFATEILLPLNQSGDAEGCSLENGAVRTPAGFKDAYTRFSDAGWNGLEASPDHGGQGLPKMVKMFVEEMLFATNMGFAAYPGLSFAAYGMLSRYGSDEQKRQYLPHLASGRWSGTMCLTEPQSGTDLGLVVTKATAQDDGSYRITGTKIFISAGDHDLTENILHLVLARLPNAPPGTKGLSLFLAPKYLPTAEGNPGERNAVSCSAIEHKMGIHACSTCVLHFENTQAWLVGAPNGGMQAMFAMMNSTRLAAGVQGLGLSEVAYQNAFLHARERLQGRRMAGAVNPDRPADPILVHPDIRKNLLTVKATTEGIRALIAWVAFNLDFAAVAPDEAQRQQADDLVQLLTPVVKAFGSDIGFDNVNLALQVFGGYGYIRETGMEQLVRDARITQIYEGTNGVQALDLIGRKLGAHRGRYPQTLIDTIQKLLDETRGNEAMTEFCKPLDQALDRLRHGLMIVARNAAADPAEAGAAATDLLRLFGYVTLGFMWARMAKLALAQLDAESDDRAFYESKLATARFYMHKLLLPQCDALLNSIRAGGSTILTFDDTLFLTS